MVPIDGTTLVDHRVFVPGGDQEALDGSATFEVGLNALSTTDLALVVNLIIDLTGRPVESFLHHVQSPFGIFAFGESLPEMVLFLLEQLRLATHCCGPMGEGVDDTKFG